MANTEQPSSAESVDVSAADKTFTSPSVLYVGSFGDIGCFSTYAAHIISTGVGGLSVTSDVDLHQLMKSLMNHGRNTAYTRIDDDADASGDELFDIAKIFFG